MKSADPLWRSAICLSLANGFEEDLASVGLQAAVERLGAAPASNALTLESDERMSACVLSSELSGAELAEAICSARRMALPGASGVY